MPFWSFSIRLKKEGNLSSYGYFRHTKFIIWWALVIHVALYLTRTEWIAKPSSTNCCSQITNMNLVNYRAYGSPWSNKWSMVLLNPSSSMCANKESDWLENQSKKWDADILSEIHKQPLSSYKWGAKNEDFYLPTLKFHLQICDFSLHSSQLS